VQVQKQSLIQEQRLRMSPQMLQSIRLMAMPIQDLKLKIQEELDRNPALELVDERGDVSSEEYERLVPTEGDDYYETAGDSSYMASGDEEGDSKRMFIEGAVSRSESLHDHLIWQLRLQPLDEASRELGELIVQSLNPDGFYSEDPAVAFTGKDAALVERLSEMIRGFEPVGCCVRDYRESLITQVRLDPEAPPGALLLLSDHLELLERGKIGDIAKKLKVGDEVAERLMDYVRGLTPFPGRQFSNDDARYVVPDLLVRAKDGEFVIVLNEEEIPVLGVNPFFMKLTGRKEDKGARDFARENVKEARWFIQSVNQRNHSLLKVARALVEYQRNFFIKGPKYLAPLTLKDIAQEVGVHETTVSRIANGKYMQTEFGIFELRYFFTNSISGSGSQGSRFSKEGVKQIIKELIESSDKKMSDQEISDSLARKGINIARRTVAKYRGELFP
jgi:RNA polymerase sigma-54 factor